MTSKETDLISSLFHSKSVETLNLAVRLREKSSSFSSMLHPITRDSIEKIIQVVNSCYACRLEGHEISAVDAEKALNGNYYKHKLKRLVQHEVVAYIETEKETEEKISKEHNLNVCSLEFISWLHKKLFDKLPDEFKKVRSKAGKIIYVIPGELREEDITDTGNSFPKAKQLRKLMFRFEKNYNPMQFSLVDSLIACAEAYRELGQIHPFLAGNGLLLRLFVKVYFKVSQLNGINLFSFNRKEYNNVLNSEKILQYDRTPNIFTSFFLKAVLDEIEFMIKTLNLDNVIESLNSYSEKLIESGKLKKESKMILKTVFLAGEIKRGEALILTGRPERTARRILRELIENKLLISGTPKGRLRINFPIKYANEIFKELF